MDDTPAYEGGSGIYILRYISMARYETPVTGLALLIHMYICSSVCVYVTVLPSLCLIKFK